MIRPGSRQKVAQLIAKYLGLPVQPIAPMESPCLPGFLVRRQAN